MTKEVVPGMAEAVEARRKNLGLSVGQLVSATGLTRPGVDNVRNGLLRDYHEKTILGFARGLHWREDWFDRLRAGDAPVEVKPPRDTGEDDALSALRREVAELRRLVERFGRPPDESR